MTEAKVNLQLTYSYSVERQVYEFLTKKPYWKSTILEKCSLSEDMSIKSKISYPLGPDYHEDMNLSRDSEPNYYFNIFINYEKIFENKISIPFSDETLDEVGDIKKIFKIIDNNIERFTFGRIAFTDNDESCCIITFTKESECIFVSFNYGTSKNNDKQVRHTTEIKVPLTEQLKYCFQKLIIICDKIRDL